LIDDDDGYRPAFILNNFSSVLNKSHSVVFILDEVYGCCGYTLDLNFANLSSLAFIAFDI